MPLKRKSKLTKRQKQCLDLILDGLSAKEIGNRLGITKSTVESHLYVAYRALGFDGGRRHLLKNYRVKHGLLSWD